MRASTVTGAPAPGLLKGHLPEEPFGATYEAHAILHVKKQGGGSGRSLPGSSLLSAHPTGSPLHSRSLGVQPPPPCEGPLPVCHVSRSRTLGPGGGEEATIPAPPCLLTSLCCCQAGEGCGGGHRSESRNQHHGFTNRERDPPAGSTAGLASAPAGLGGCRGSHPSQPRAGWASGPGRVQPARGQVQRPSRSRSRPRGPSRAVFSSLAPPASRFSPPGLFFSSLCSWA